MLQVPRTKTSRLLRELAKVEPRLAKLTGYHSKLVEREGLPLSKLLCVDLSSPTCHRDDCVPCKNPNMKGSSLCTTKNIVYESVCSLCNIEYLKDTSKGT